MNAATAPAALGLDIRERTLTLSGTLTPDASRSVNQPFNGRLFYPDQITVEIDLATDRPKRVFVAGPARIGQTVRLQRTYRAGDQIPSWLLNTVVRPLISGELG
ncbi:hypothetical protein SEA_EVAA_52 [Gordonia phage Evaa]|nr:hypothetical protein SEA_EVAA_52 [Gordonia phage Evaa]